MGAFPERIDVRKAFAKNARYDAVIPLEKFERLKQYLCSTEDALKDESPVNVQVEFAQGEQRQRLIKGSVATSVQMQCQRCLNAMDVELKASPELVVVDSEEAAREQAGSETIIPSDEGLDLLSLVEDELILCLPLAPRHSDENCNETLSELSGLSKVDKQTELKTQQGSQGTNADVMEQLLQLKKSLSENGESKE